MATMGGSRPGEQRGGRKPGTPNKPQLVITHADQLVRGAASQGFQYLGVTQLPQLVTSGYHRGLASGNDPANLGVIVCAYLFPYLCDVPPGSKQITNLPAQPIASATNSAANPQVAG